MMTKSGLSDLIRERIASRKPGERVRREPDPAALGQFREPGERIGRDDARLGDGPLAERISHSAAEESEERGGILKIRRGDQFECGAGRGAREVLRLEPLPLLPLKGGGVSTEGPRQEVADDAKFEFCRVHVNDILSTPIPYISSSKRFPSSCAPSQARKAFSRSKISNWNGGNREGKIQSGRLKT